MESAVSVTHFRGVAGVAFKFGFVSLKTIRLVLFSLVVFSFGKIACYFWRNRLARYSLIAKFFFLFSFPLH